MKISICSAIFAFCVGLSAHNALSMNEIPSGPKTSSFIFKSIPDDKKIQEQCGLAGAPLVGKKSAAYAIQEVLMNGTALHLQSTLEQLDCSMFIPKEVIRDGVGGKNALGLSKTYDPMVSLLSFISCDSQIPDPLGKLNILLRYGFYISFKGEYVATFSYPKISAQIAEDPRLFGVLYSEGTSEYELNENYSKTLVPFLAAEQKEKMVLKHCNLVLRFHTLRTLHDLSCPYDGTVYGRVKGWPLDITLGQVRSKIWRRALVNYDRLLKERRDISAELEKKRT